ncbi:MAG: hypothetical protein IH983_13120 [Planctomycetes bacterium]|nr:hypothetical protein [Planctomycetota bacterium]
MLCGILHSGNIATLNRKSKRRAGDSGGPGTAPSTRGTPGQVVIVHLGLGFVNSLA